MPHGVPACRPGLRAGNQPHRLAGRSRHVGTSCPRHPSILSEVAFQFSELGRFKLGCLSVSRWWAVNDPFARACQESLKACVLPDLREAMLPGASSTARTTPLQQRRRMTTGVHNSNRPTHRSRAHGATKPSPGPSGEAATLVQGLLIRWCRSLNSSTIASFGISNWLSYVRLALTILVPVT